MQAIRHLVVSEAAAVEVDRSAYDQYNEELDEALAQMICRIRG